MIGLIDNPDPPAEPIEREYNDAALLFQNDEQVLERIERLERLERSTMTDIETDLMLARAEIATLKADLAAQTARAAKAEQERDRADERFKNALKEIIKLACESVEREKTLARLEAEVMARLEERHETD
jgi:arylamine N-acetyltransferase